MKRGEEERIKKDQREPGKTAGKEKKSAQKAAASAGKLLRGYIGRNMRNVYWAIGFAVISAAAVLIVTNTWNIVMGVFDVAQSVVNSASGVIVADASIDTDTYSNTHKHTYTYIILGSQTK